MSNLADTNIVTLLDAFLAHWATVNPLLSKPIVLSGGYERAQLVAERASVVAALADLEALDNERVARATLRDQMRDALRERMRQFKGMCAALFPGTPFARPGFRLPIGTAGEASFLRACEATLAHWERVDAELPAGLAEPLTLAGEYAREQFEGDLAALREACLVARRATTDLRFARRQKQALTAPIGPRLAQYRLAVLGSFASGAPAIESLPRYTARRRRKKQPAPDEASE